jgi:phosphoenolpyruvate phosphomutase
MDKKTTALRSLITSKELGSIIEAHSGLSAKLVEEAGAKGIWASGLAISSALGVRDCNEASWTQVLDVIEYIADTTRIPMLVDGDSGYGNFNNFRRFVAKLEQRGAAGVCIEDKLFPKANSFLDTRHDLIGIDEFCGKIKAAKDILRDPHFVIVARVESFIAGAGLDDALARASAYRDAGADAIFIHSKRSDADEIAAFCRAWNGRLPVVVAPTTYADTPMQTLSDMGVSLVVWANHIVRASTYAMRACAEHLVRNGGPAGLANLISVPELLRLSDVDELIQAEMRYAELTWQPKS